MQATKTKSNPLIYNNQYLIVSLLLVAMATTLVSSTLFVYQTLASYFLFAFITCIITIYAGIGVWKNSMALRFSFPFVLFLIWGIYISLHGLNQWNIKHSYLIMGILFYISTTISFSNAFTYSKKIYWVIIGLAVAESLVCILQYIGLLPDLNIYFKVTGTTVNPNVTAMFLAMALGPYLLLLFETQKQIYYYKWLKLLGFVLIIVALLLLKCRTAFLGATVSAAILINANIVLLNI